MKYKIPDVSSLVKKQIKTQKLVNSKRNLKSNLANLKTEVDELDINK